VKFLALWFNIQEEIGYQELHNFWVEKALMS